MAENLGRELDWGDEIQNDGPEFVLLPDGDYPFEVIGIERGRHAGSDKLPPCNKAILNIRLEGPQGIATVKHNLFLHSSVEGLLCSFFTAIGQRKHGEKLKMNWAKVPGARGRCKVGIRKWTSDRDGREYENNEIRRFYEPEEAEEEF